MACYRGQPTGKEQEERGYMSLLVILIVLAVIFGGIGLFVAAAKWALIIAVIFLIAGLISGFTGRRGTRRL